MAAIRHIESHTQIACKRWFDFQFPQLSKLLFAVPNGGLRGRVEAGIMKAEGVVPGVSDMILLVGRKGYNALCIEFKTKTGRQSPQQKRWQMAAERHGNKYIIVRCCEEFVTEVARYLQ